MSYKKQKWVEQPGVQPITQARLNSMEAAIKEATKGSAKQPIHWRRIAGVVLLALGFDLVFTLMFAGMGSINSPTSFWGAFWSVLPGMSAFAGSILVAVLGYALVFDE